MDTDKTASGQLVGVAAADFDLALTLDCGQAFHWRRHGAGWLGMIGDAPCYAEQRGETLLVPAGLEEIASRYFALDHPLAAIRASFPRDPRLDAASAHCRGLRVLRLMRAHRLLSPHRAAFASAKAHDGRIITDAPDVRWATDGSKIWTTDDGWVWLFDLVEHWNGECLGRHVCKIGDRYAAWEPLAQALGASPRRRPRRRPRH